VVNDGESSGFGSSLWSVENIHQIGLLDIRIFNMDRNGENMLVQKRAGPEVPLLIPIDHTYCLPPITSLDNAYFEWQYWPQAKKPFSQESVEYVQSLDPRRDAEILRSLGISEECILTNTVTTMLLKETVSCGWTLYQIACFLSRDLATLTVLSRFEELIFSCREAAMQRGCSFLELYSEALHNLVVTTLAKN